MEKNTTSIFLRSNLPGGVLMGVIFCIASFALHQKSGQIYMNGTLDNIIMFLYILGITFQIRKYRNEVLGGFITYGHALKTGVYLGFIVGVLYGIYTFFMYSSYPQLLENYKMITETALKQVYGNSPITEHISAMVKVFTTPFSMAFSEFFAKIFSGFFYSLFIAWFIRRRPETA